MKLKKFKCAHCYKRTIPVLSKLTAWRSKPLICPKCDKSSYVAYPAVYTLLFPAFLLVPAVLISYVPFKVLFGIASAGFALEIVFYKEDPLLLQSPKRAERKKDIKIDWPREKK